MIDRYTRPEMAVIWTDEAKFQTFLEVEIAVCEAQAELGYIPSAAVDDIRKKAGFKVERIREIEEEVKHDVIAFLTNVAEHVGENSRYVHLGLTSSDVIDTALALQMRKAGQIISKDLQDLHDAILAQARKHKATITIGRSHGIHAEPTTFGFKLCIWLEEIKRQQKRFADALEMISVGQLSGAVGTYSNIDPEVERLVCRNLNLQVAPVSTQIIQRDRHAQYIWALSMIASSLEKFAVEIRHLQRTDVLEAEEPFSEGQKGSSAMPHKRNPVGSENISGLARVVRANALAAMENIPLWHERDISHSSVERIILPDSTILVDYMLARFTKIVSGLVVYPENMRRNMDKYGGVIFSQSVMLKMIDKGLSREEAYKLVQSNAMKAWNKEDGNFKDNLKNDPSVTKVLPEADIDACFDPEHYLRNLNKVFERLGV
ncbi:MAG: adenylosuccinate lyase [Candidatus Obscuribacterales bacterium]|nr:adenylosuccinate lyase [Candidatus Obscuribacterales bacterium]